MALASQTGIARLPTALEPEGAGGALQEVVVVEAVTEQPVTMEVLRVVQDEEAHDTQTSVTVDVEQAPVVVTAVAVFVTSHPRIVPQAEETRDVVTVTWLDTETP